MGIRLKHFLMFDQSLSLPFTSTSRHPSVPHLLPSGPDQLWLSDTDLERFAGLSPFFTFAALPNPLEIWLRRGQPPRTSDQTMFSKTPPTAMKT